MPDTMRKFFRTDRKGNEGAGAPPPVLSLGQDQGRRAPGRQAVPAQLQEAVSTLSHELRAPLTAMKSSLDLVLKEEAGPLNADQRHFLGMTMRSIDRLDRLVSDMLDVARAGAGHLVLRPQKTDLGPLLAEVAEVQGAAAVQAGLAFDAGGLPETFPAELDPDKVRQILDNVLGNAIKYTGAPGRIRLWLQPKSVQIDDLAWNLARQFHLPCNQFTLVVEDSGRGMDAQAMRSLFDPFRRAHDETACSVPGSGLGLHICKGLAEAMQGSLRLASRPGRGTTVWIRLPRDLQTAGLLKTAAQIKEILACAPPDPQPGVAVLDLRDGDRLDGPGTEAVASFLREARQAGAGRAFALTDGAWAAAILDRPAWRRLWARHWSPVGGADHAEHWRPVPMDGPRPALEPVRDA